MEPIHYSRSRDSCCGMPVEKGCLIFAVINMTSVGFSVLGSLCMLALVIQGYIEQGFSSHVLFFTILTAACTIGTFIALTFGVLLLVGLTKRKHQFVMAYLVYGVLAEAASVGGILTFIVMEWEEWILIGYISIFLGICVLYPFVLWLVYRAYAALAQAPQANSPLFGPRKLPHREYEC